MTRAARRRSAGKRHDVRLRVERFAAGLRERLAELAARLRGEWLAYVLREKLRTRVAAVFVDARGRITVWSALARLMAQVVERHRRDDLRLWVVTDYPRSLTAWPDDVKLALQGAGEMAFYFMSTIPTPLSTCRAHTRCRTTKDYVPWTPNVVNVPLYYGSTITKPTPDMPAWTTIPAGYFFVPVVGALMRKPTDEVWTTVWLVSANVTSPLDRGAVIVDNDGVPRFTMPVVLMHFMHHRVLKIKAMFAGRAEESDAWIHCSLYYMPTSRPSRAPRNYLFYEYYAGLWNWRRIRIRHPMKQRR